MSMKTFDDLVFDSKSDPCWTRAREMFDNGYGVSVVRSYYSYGGDEGYWELAVLDSDGGLTYDTSVTTDVEGWLTPGKVTELMRQVQELEKLGLNDEVNHDLVR